MQCRCRLHSCNHGKIVKTSTKTKKINVLPYKDENSTFQLPSLLYVFIHCMFSYTPFGQKIINKITV